MHPGSPHWPLRISISNCVHHLFWPQLIQAHELWGHSLEHYMHWSILIILYGSFHTMGMFYRQLQRHETYCTRDSITFHRVDPSAGVTK